MARSIRLVYKQVKGRQRKNYNWAPIKLDSAVLITAAEFKPFTPEERRHFGGPKTAGRPHLGDANVYVTNIGPHGPEGSDGGVEFYLHADADHPIPVVVTITVFDDIESFEELG